MQILATANQLLIDRFGEIGPLLALGLLGLVLIVGTLPVMLRRSADPLDKLSRTDTDPAKRADLRSAKGTDRLDRYKEFLEPKDAAEYSAIKLKLVQAGYRRKTAVRTYYFAQFALGITFLMLGGAYAIYAASTGAPSTRTTIMSILIPGVIGYMLPRYLVTKRQQKRQEEIQNGFPDSLDMMLVCVEAGQSLDQSIMRVAREIRAGFPALADEFQMVADEIKAGKDKQSVLRDMAERAGVPDVSSFVTVLIQSQTFGTSIAEALRVYASEMRDKRVMRAEEKANTLPTKMTLATMMLTVPPLLIILIGPSVMDIVKLMNADNF